MTCCGEILVYLGCQYRLKVLQDAITSAKLAGRFLRVSVPDSRDCSRVERVVLDWFREHARLAFS